MVLAQLANDRSECLIKGLPHPELVVQDGHLALGVFAQGEYELECILARELAEFKSKVFVDGIEDIGILLCFVRFSIQVGENLKEARD